ncbi:30S ribosomal protein S5 [Halobacteriales archaeon SW_7_71_33]|jgi:small subunit ribosomal protein S5|nr:MAG: 30S ribosomal protein S5 [Halobacteriales archaeon SW_5_70_135]PSQ41121.1 MAG: 30S ribosomal protein S5 [Halobacteriales archaeon SW_12_71_31]PSQ59089.1 MAG: 30S ribosomal protein S5 [Halobacteriales archaeon SW_7_71_33]
MSADAGGWQPRTRLGQQVQDDEITDMEQALESGLPLKEPAVVDQLLPGLDDEVLDINMVQRMTDSGRRVKFRCVVVIGDRNGFVGYAEGRDDQVGSAIQKAIDIAKLNMIKVDRGSGSWEDRSDEPHSLKRRTEGKAGSVTVELEPAPLGLGLAASDTVEAVLDLAGIENAWTKSYGNTRTTLNLGKATFRALETVSTGRADRRDRVAEELGEEVVER